jgi:hypothetical protein
MVDESVTVKGTPARSLQRFLDAELTAAQRDELFRALPVDYSQRFRTPVLATETLPVHMLNRLTEEAARIKGEPLDRFARRAGREAAAEAVKGIYRFFALVMTPAALLSRATHMWSTVYSRGELQIESGSGKAATIRLVNFPAEVAGCARITGWIERMLEMTGVRAIRIEKTQCFARGEAACEWQLRWE